MTVYGTAPHMSIRYTADGNPNASSAVNAFNTTVLSGSTSIISSDQIDYEPTNGEFTVREGGVYCILFTGYLTVGGTGILTTYNLRVNNIAELVASTEVHTATNPAERTMMIIKRLNNEDLVTVAVGETTNLTLITGTTLNIWKID